MRLILEFVAAVRRVFEAPDRDPLESAFLSEAGNSAASDLRLRQTQAVCLEFGIDPAGLTTAHAWEMFQNM